MHPAKFGLAPTRASAILTMRPRHAIRSLGLTPGGVKVVPIVNVAPSRCASPYASYFPGLLGQTVFAPPLGRTL